MKLKCVLVACLLITLSACSSVRPWTRNEGIALVTSIVATGVNIHATRQVLNDGGYEVNPLIDGNPTLGMISTELLCIVISHYWPDVRIPLLGGKAVINTGLAVHDYRVGK